MIARAVLAALALASSEAASAADRPEAIVVNAPGGAIDADDAVTLPADAIQALPRPDLLAALARSVPGVALQDAEGNPWQAGISWHGYSLSSLQGTEQGLAVYLDGVRFNQPFGDTLLLDTLPEAALASAELRAPGPVYGRNALGGALLLRSATAEDTPGVTAKAWVDSIGGTGVSGSVGLRRGPDDVLLVGEAVRDPGWREASPSRLSRFALSADHTGAGWGIGVRANYADTRLTGNGASPVELLAADYRAVFTIPDLTSTRAARLVLLPWIDLSPTGRLEATLHGSLLARHSTGGDLGDFTNCATDPTLLCVDSGGVEPAGLVGPNGSAVPIDRPIADYAVVNRGDERTREAGAGLQFLDSRPTAKGVRRIAVGAEFSRARTAFAAVTDLGLIDAERRVGDLGLALASTDGSITPASFVTNLNETALYASVQLPITRTLHVEIGARWSRTTIALDDRLGTSLSGRHSYARLNPSIEFDQDVAGLATVHAGYAETSRTPTPAELSCADPAAPCALSAFFVSDPALRQVVARHWTLGAHGELGLLSWRIEGWRADADDDIRQVASQVRGRAYFVNGGRSRRQGIDLSLQARLSRWTIGASGSLVDARYRDGFVTSSPDNPAADDDGLVSVPPGSRIPGIAREQARLTIDYAGRMVDGGFALRAQSPQPRFGDPGNATPMVPGYVVADLSARWRASRRLEISAAITNLFDRRYATFGAFTPTNSIALVEAPGASDPRADTPAPPRRLSIAVKVTL